MSLRKNTFIISQNKYCNFFFACAVLFFTHVLFAHAATLSISPSNETVSAGKTIIVRVQVNSAGQSINAVSGGVIFSNNLLTLTSISKSNSIVSLWAQDPSYSNVAGTASFQGVVLNGFNGVGTVLTLAFRTKAAGIATIALDPNSSSVLLNDGQGTNVLSGTSGDTVVITATQSSTSPVQPVVVPVISVSQPAALPVITQYQNTLLSNNFVVVRGTADAGSTLTVTLSGPNGVAQSTVITGSDGVFTYVSDNKVMRGIYSVAIATADGRKITPITITVSNPASFVLGTWLKAIISFKINLVWVILFILISLYLWHRNRILRRHLKDAIDKAHDLQIK